MAGLTQKIVRSFGWVFANMATKAFLDFLRTVLLWRILSEDEFGLNGMAWLAINAFTLLQDMGFQSALVHRRTDLEKAVTVTWYANVAIRVVVYFLLFLAAPFVADHFEEPEVCAILRVASLAIVIGSFGSANQALLRRNFQFERILVVDTIELALLVASQVVLALLGFGVWSLVYGTLVGATSRSLLLWRLAPIRLGKLDLKVAREMFHFGKHMTVSSLLIWLIGHMDYYFIGKFLGKAALGFYTLAFRIAFLIATRVARLLGSVLFPAFSEIGNDVTRVRSAWLRSIRYSTLLMMPMALGMMIFSRELLVTFYKAKCEIVVAPLAILTLSALFRALGVPLGDLQKGIGKPGLLTRVALWHAVLMGPLLLGVTVAVEPGIRAVLGAYDLRPHEVSLAVAFLAPVKLFLGLTGVSAAVTGTTLVAGLGVALILTAREVRYTPGMVLDAIRPAILAGVAMVAIGAASKLLTAWLLPGIPTVVRLVVLGPFSVVGYGLVLWFAFPSVAAELRQMFPRLRRKRASEVAPAVSAPSLEAPPFPNGNGAEAQEP